MADDRSDLYSLAAIFYYAPSGSLSRTVCGIEVLARNLKMEPRPLEELRPDIPTALAGIIRRLMAKNPDNKRFSWPGRISERTVLLPASSCGPVLSTVVKIGSFIIVAHSTRQA